MATFYVALICLLTFSIVQCYREIKCDENKGLEFSKMVCQCYMSCQQYSTFCTYVACHPGCKCKEGLIQDRSTRTCVPLEKCPGYKPCPVDMVHFPDCSIPTCKKPHTSQYGGAPIEPCNLTTQCRCKGDLVLDESTNRCILLKDCPK